MNTRLEKYLNTVEKNLMPLPISERVDIIKEIKSSMFEMENNNLSIEEILKKLGDPKDLAKAYLSDLLVKNKGLNWNRILIVIAYYSLAGLSGLIVIPCLAVITPVLLVGGIITPILGTYKLVDYLFNLHLPFVNYIGIAAGGKSFLGIIPLFVFSVICGILLYFLGKWSWKAMLYYCRKMHDVKEGLCI